jgi:voltage-gated potassium channel
VTGRGHNPWRRRLHAALEGGTAAGLLGSVIEVGLITLIILNVFAFAAETVPAFLDAYGHLLDEFEIFSVAVFTFEYGLRLWCAVEDPRIGDGGAFAGRLSFAARPLMVIDLLSVLPAYFAFFVPGLDLRVLRVFRLIRLLKITRYSPALQTLASVVVEEQRALFGTLLLLLITVMFSATAMYLAEGSIQPDVFGTIPSAMWWAITTLTTVGYGDAVPLTALGRMIGGITMIAGLGLFALPVGIMATAFVNAIRRRDFVVTFGMLSRVPMFAAFNARVLGEVMGLLRTQMMKSGEIIAAAGEPARAMYFVVSGEVEAELPERTFRFGPGDFFGERALLHNTKRSATMVALTQCRLLTLSAGDFNTLLKKHPDLNRRVQEIARVRLKELEDAQEIAQAELDAAGKGREDASAGE